jgi:hypothetical protein
MHGSSNGDRAIYLIALRQCGLIATDAKLSLQREKVTLSQNVSVITSEPRLSGSLGFPYKSSYSMVILYSNICDAIIRTKDVMETIVQN